MELVKLSVYDMADIKELFKTVFTREPWYEGQGIGGKFLEAVEEYLKANGVYGIFLLTDRDVSAYNFYKSHGFHEETTNVAFGKYLK